MKHAHPGTLSTVAPSRAALLLLLLCSPAAWAEGLSLDPEILQATFSNRSMPGIDRADIEGEGAMRVGTILQYEQNPLVLRNDEGARVPIIANRADAQLGIAYDWSKRFSSRVVIPVAWQHGGDVPSLAADAIGLRDTVVGGRVALSSSESSAFSARLDLHLPTGVSETYMGEDIPSVDAGMLARVSFGPMELLADLGFTGRRSFDTDYDLVLGPEGVLNVGLRHTIPSGKLSLGLGALTRAGAQTEFGGGVRSEALFTVQTWPTEGLKLDVGLGRGLTVGPGTTGARALVGVTWFRPPKKVEVAPVVGRVLDDPDALRARPKAELLDDYPEKDEDIQWKQGELARVGVNATHIAIREPIQFVVATANILPESLPVLDAVAELMASYWQIDHLLIEGHASEEGSYDYNYDLSMERAEAVYKALMEAGVYPSRLSFRAYGEVAPRAAEGSAAEELAANRRVEFHIERLLDPLEPPPRYPEEVQLPWNGETVFVRTGTERLVGATELDMPLGPNEDQQALDILKGYLHEDAPQPAPNPTPKPPPERVRPPEPEEEPVSPDEFRAPPDDDAFDLPEERADEPPPIDEDPLVPDEIAPPPAERKDEGGDSVQDLLDELDSEDSL
ncbi:MAG: OmpA family protein [Pseudomonadota bacterium]